MNTTIERWPPHLSPTTRQVFKSSLREISAFTGEFLEAGGSVIVEPVVPSRVLVCSSFPPEWSELAKISCRTHEKWAERWGYKYFVDCSDTSWPVRGPEWGLQEKVYLPIRSFVKLDLLVHFLDPESCREQYDWVMWLDADQLVTNYEIPITRWTESLEPYEVPRLGPPQGKDIIAPYDYNGNNSTTIIVRNTDHAFNFLYSCNDSGRTLFLKHGWAEMEAMLRFRLAPPYSDILQAYSAKELCALHPGEYKEHPLRRRKPYEWELGDFSVHLSALTIERRLELARHYAEALNLL